MHIQPLMDPRFYSFSAEVSFDSESAALEGFRLWLSSESLGAAFQPQSFNPNSTDFSKDVWNNNNLQQLTWIQIINVTDTIKLKSVLLNKNKIKKTFTIQWECKLCKTNDTGKKKKALNTSCCVTATDNVNKLQVFYFYSPHREPGAPFQSLKQLHLVPFKTCSRYREFQVYRGVSQQLATPGQPPKKVLKRHSEPRPETPQLAPFHTKEQLLLTVMSAKNLISKAEPRHSNVETAE